MRTWVLVGAIVTATLALSLWLQRGGAPRQTIAVAVPELTGEAKAGEALFEANCATCHGSNAGGSDKGPPLVHKVYEPNHHADGAFLRAVQYGVRAHHWPFGNMPAQSQVSPEQVSKIIAYVRSLQRANGIY